MNRIIVSLLWVALGLFSRTALAWDCSTVTPSTTLSPQNITISRDLPVGAVIGTQIMTPTVNAFSCFDSADGVISNQTFGVKAIGTFDSMVNGVRVYKTNVDGIGYAISGSTAKCAGGNAAVTGANTIRDDINTARLCQNTTGMISPGLNGSVTVTFYKTATETGSGTISARMVGSLILLNNSLLWQSPEAAVNINAFTVTTPACKLTTPLFITTLPAFTDSLKIIRINNRKERRKIVLLCKDDELSEFYKNLAIEVQSILETKLEEGFYSKLNADVPS